MSAANLIALLLTGVRDARRKLGGFGIVPSSGQQPAPQAPQGARVGRAGVVLHLFDTLRPTVEIWALDAKQRSG